LTLASGAPRLAARQLAALLQQPGEFAAAVRGGRAYSLRLIRASEPRRRTAPRVKSAFVAGGTKASVALASVKPCSPAATPACSSHSL
jgi:hypothetical protein